MKIPDIPVELSKGEKMVGREGAILGMVLVIMLAVSVVGLSLLQLGAVNAVEVSRNLNRDQAFWSADAGLQQARAVLMGNESIRKGFFPYAFSGADLGYNGQIASVDNINFGIVSTGMWQSAVRIVKQSIKIEEGWPSAFDYAIYSGDHMELREGSVIAGDIYADNGYQFIATPPSVSGGIYDDVPGGEYSAPDPVPGIPKLDVSYYDALIANAEASTTASPVYPLSLGGHTNYLKMANYSVGGRINGPGVLVVSGDISISSGSAVIGSDVMLISGGTFTIDKDCTSGSNNLFYAATGFDLAKNNNISIGSCALVTPGTINIKKELNFSGLIYAGGTIDADKVGTVVGAIVAGGDVRLKMDYTVTYDASLLPLEMFPGLEPELKVVESPWSEEFP